MKIGDRVLSLYWGVGTIRCFSDGDYNCGIEFDKPKECIKGYPLHNLNGNIREENGWWCAQKHRKRTLSGLLDSYISYDSNEEAFILLDDLANTGNKQSLISVIKNGDGYLIAEDGTFTDEVCEATMFSKTNERYRDELLSRYPDAHIVYINITEIGEKKDD